VRVWRYGVMYKGLRREAKGNVSRHTFHGNARCRWHAFTQGCVFVQLEALEQGEVAAGNLTATARVGRIGLKYLYEFTVEAPRYAVVGKGFVEVSPRSTQ
jgi:hypothetical protein